MFDRLRIKEKDQIEKMREEGRHPRLPPEISISDKQMEALNIYPIEDEIMVQTDENKRRIGNYYMETRVFKTDEEKRDYLDYGGYHEELSKYNSDVYATSQATQSVRMIIDEIIKKHENPYTKIMFRDLIYQYHNELINEGKSNDNQCEDINHDANIEALKNTL
jgi:hypothetical protein